MVRDGYQCVRYCDHAGVPRRKRCIITSRMPRFKMSQYRREALVPAAEDVRGAFGSVRCMRRRNGWLCDGFRCGGGAYWLTSFTCPWAPGQLSRLGTSRSGNVLK